LGLVRSPRGRDARSSCEGAKTVFAMDIVLCFSREDEALGRAQGTCRSNLLFPAAPRALDFGIVLEI
jgi:hypothetical protein